MVMVVGIVSYMDSNEHNSCYTSGSIDTCDGIKIKLNSIKGNE